MQTIKIIIIHSKYFPASDWLNAHAEFTITSCSWPNIEPMTSKWRQKCSPLQIIETLTEKTWGQGCVIFGERKNKERNGKTPLRTGKYFARIRKQLLHSAFVGYEEFCRSPGGCYPTRPSASVNNTLLDLQNSSYPNQPHSIIPNYTLSSVTLNWLTESVHWIFELSAHDVITADYTIIMSRILKVTGYHVKYDRDAWFLRVIMSSSRALCWFPSVKK